VLATPSDDGQLWPKHVNTKLLLISIKVVTFDELLLLTYILSGVTVQDVAYKDENPVSSFLLEQIICSEI
jgi:hypothetical protein